jgi:predicted RNA binding protein YcfA (HicA-like mRNA interferase family)
MTKLRKLLMRILRGKSDANIGFEELRNILLNYGFEERVRGSHHLFIKEGVEELINLQRDGKSAKPYQVKQVRRIILRYGLGGDD